MEFKLGLTFDRTKYHLNNIKSLIVSLVYGEPVNPI